MGKHKPEYEIGIRAAAFIADYAAQIGVPIQTALHRMGLERKTIYAWRLGDCAPSAFALQAIALCGGDVDYILTGRKERCSKNE